MSWEKTDTNLEHIYHHPDSDMDMLRRFLNANGFNRMHSYQAGMNVTRVLSSGGFYGMSSYISDDPPYLDHKQYFKNSSTGLCCLTYNPYQYADEIRAEVEQWALANGLEAEVYDAAHSWYYPGNTCFVVIHIPGEKIVLE